MRRKNTWSRPPHLVGTKSSHWKGDNVAYSGLHHWIRKTFGKAYRCENNECIYPRKNNAHQIIYKPKRFEWACISRIYNRERKNWIMLCPSCHRKYDIGIIKVIPTHH